MLTEFDDYLCHQIMEAIDNPRTSDLRFYCRHFMLFYNKTGEICGLTGMGVYPNSEVMDGFAVILLSDKTQRNLRVSRKLEHDRHNTVVGPVRIEMIDPLRKFRIMCEDNPQGFTYDMVCETTTRPFERRPMFRTRQNGRVTNSSIMFMQAYRCTGTITIDGRTQIVTPDTWFGSRDHSWGFTDRFWEGPYIYGPTGTGQGAACGSQGMQISPVGGTPLRHDSWVTFLNPDPGPYGQGMFPVGGKYARHDSWVTFMKDGRDECYFDFWLTPPHIEGGEIIYPWGDPRPPLKLVGIERKNVIWSERDKTFKSLELIVTDEHGKKMEISVRRLCTLFERGAGYEDCGTPFQFGKPMGKFHMEFDTWDVAEHPEKYRGRSLAHISEYRWGDMVGYGMFECNAETLWEQPYAKYLPPTIITKPESS